MGKAPFTVVIIINIILVILIVAILGWVFQMNSVYEQQTRQYDMDRQNRIDQIESLEGQVTSLQGQLDDANAKITENTDNSITYRSYGIYSYQGYQFAKPEAWTGVTTDAGIEFQDEEGTVIALMQCPIIETAYEAWDFVNSTREIDADDGAYRVSLALGTPKEEVADLGLLHLITMAPTDDDRFSDSCQIINSDADHDYSEVFRRVFESVSVAAE